MLTSRVLLVNHQPIYRAGLRLAVESTGGFLVVGEAASGYQAMQEALNHARTQGPYLLEAVTYRYRGHSMADPELYRLKDEVDRYRKRDAIEQLKAHMEERGELDDAKLNEIVERVQLVVDQAVQFAENSPNPPISSLMDHIYKDSPDA